jgi:anaerobic ribonucleoside-triphosphate reductase activating protein
MNLAHIENRSFIYGPGCRFVIWTQGCSIRCEGCWNGDMWEFEPNIVMSVGEISELITAEGQDIEGVTILGGEPLDQSEECVELLRSVKASGLTTMLFTGYESGEITDGRVFELCDILITGRYDQSKRTLYHQWIGSTNQEIRFLTDVYRDYEIKDANYVEIGIEEDGRVTMLGFPPDHHSLLSTSRYSVSQSQSSPRP